MLDPVKNYGIVAVSTGYDDLATTIVLATGEGATLPDPATDGAFNITYWNDTDYPNIYDDPNREIVRVTARSTDTLTVTRGQEGESATTKNTAGKTYKMLLAPTKKTIDDIETYTVKTDDTDVSGNSWVLDEDTMVSNSATKVPTQQSVKAYVDNSTITQYSNIPTTDISKSDNTATTFLEKTGVVVASGQKTRITAWARLSSNTVGDRIKFVLKRGSTELIYFTSVAHSVNGQSTMLEWIDEPSAGTYTYTITWQKDTGTGNTSNNASSLWEKRILNIVVD